MKQLLIVGIGTLTIGLVAGFYIGRDQATCHSDSVTSAFLHATEVAAVSAASLEMLGDSENARLRNLLSARLRYNLDVAYSWMADVRTVDLAIPNLVESAARVEEFTRSNEQFREATRSPGRAECGCPLTTRSNAWLRQRSS